MRTIRASMGGKVGQYRIRGKRGRLNVGDVVYVRHQAQPRGKWLHVRIYRYDTTSSTYFIQLWAWPA